MEVPFHAIVAETHRVFHKADTSGDGLLQHDEFFNAVTMVMKACGLDELIRHVEQFAQHEWNVYDADKSGAIDEEEFGAWIVRFCDCACAGSSNTRPLPPIPARVCYPALCVCLMTEASCVPSGCAERKELEDAGIDTQSKHIRLPPGSDAEVLVPAIVRHCPCVSSFSAVHGNVTTDDLFSLANKYKDFIESVELSGSTGFKPVGLRAFAAFCPALHTLRLDACADGLDDETLIILAKKCEALRLVAIDGCRVTKAAIAKLETLLAGCTVEGEPLALPPTPPPPEPVVEVVAPKRRRWGLRIPGLSVFAVTRRPPSRVQPMVPHERMAGNAAQLPPQMEVRTKRSCCLAM
jgi:hypothetical protein